VRLICWRVLDNSGVGVGAVGDYVDVGVAVRGDARRWRSFRADRPALLIIMASSRPGN
jgi:hypothetical protein